MAVAARVYHPPGQSPAHSPPSEFGGKQVGVAELPPREAGGRCLVSPCPASIPRRTSIGTPATSCRAGVLALVLPRCRSGDGPVCFVGVPWGGRGFAPPAGESMESQARLALPVPPACLTLRTDMHSLVE